MDGFVRGLNRLGNLVGFHTSEFLHRVGGRLVRNRPADYSIELDDLYRMEGHWALTFSRLGTVHWPSAQLKQLGEHLDTTSYFRVLWRSRRAVASHTLRVFEKDDADPFEGRSIRVGDDYYGPSVADNVVYYPYVMHPWVYAHGWHNRVARLRRTPRRFQLFFSGVVNEGYGERFDFPIMSRPEVVECVLDTFRSDSCVVTKRSDLAILRRTDRPIALVVFRGAITPMASNHFLARETYLRFLAQSRFALCPPGVFMPHAHNLIETMSVGTIPLTNYSEFCRPRLTSGKTCVAFSTPTELTESIRRILSTPLAEISLMKEAVTRYFDEELSPDGIARKLKRSLQRPALEYPLMLNREFKTARVWTQRNPIRLQIEGKHP